MAMLVDPEPAAQEPAQPAHPLPAGGFDLTAAGDAPVPRSVISVTGWAVTPTGACSRIELTVNGHRVGRARLGEMRRDAQLYLGQQAAALSGFHHFVNLAEVPGLGADAELGGFMVGLDGARFSLPPVRVRVEPAQPEPEVTSQPRTGRPSAPRKQPGGAHERQELRLLVCTHELGYGGAQLFLTELVRRLAELGPLSGLVISPVDGPTRGILEEHGFEVHVTSPFPVGSLDAYDARLEELAGWAAGKEFDAALVNTMGSFPGADLASRLGLPTIWAIHESYPLPEYWAMLDGVIDPAVQRRAEAALRSATATFTCDATRGCYEPHIPGLRCLTMPYGIDVAALDAWRERFDRAAARHGEGIGDDERILLCLGTIEPRKAQTQLIHAYAQIADRHPATRLQLVGSRGDYHSEAAYEAVSLHGLGQRVRIQPVLADVRPCYAMADLLISASDVESTPRSILEAMALGLPVLSTNVFGVPEVIADGESGWLCEPRDVAALATALDRVLSLDATQRSAIAAQARAEVETHYRSEVCSRAWDQALRDLAFSPAATAPLTDQPLRTKLVPAQARGN
jgi:D-inositol-3-phosphate glycosyltransferase